MTLKEYFGDWIKVIDSNELLKVMKTINDMNIPICPDKKNIFRAFTLLTLHDLKVVFLGQD